MAMGMATMARRALARGADGGARLGSRAAARALSTSAEAAARPGPPFLRYFLYTTGIMFGIPGAVGAVFVYNLRSDDEFYAHFNERYPELIAAIEERVTLDARAAALAEREDVGPVETPELLQHESAWAHFVNWTAVEWLMAQWCCVGGAAVTVAVELASRRRVRFRAAGDASREELVATALRHSETPEDDRVLAVSIEDEDDDALKDGVEVEDVAVASLTDQQAWPPAPRTSWGGDQAETKQQSKPKPQPRKRAAVDPESEIRREIAAIREQQAAAEASKFAGRDVDDADEEIAQLESRKTALKAELPRRRFLWIF